MPVLVPPATVEVHLRRRFQCSVCSKSWSSKRTAEAHVGECIKDPSTRSCATCRHDDREAGCALGVRPEDVSCLRHCADWECVPWLQPLASATADDLGTAPASGEQPAAGS